jgi:hypothetical protein
LFYLLLIPPTHVKYVSKDTQDGRRLASKAILVLLTLIVINDFETFLRKPGDSVKGILPRQRDSGFKARHPIEIQIELDQVLVRGKQLIGYHVAIHIRS